MSRNRPNDVLIRRAKDVYRKSTSGIGLVIDRRVELITTAGGADGRPVRRLKTGVSANFLRDALSRSMVGYVHSALTRPKSSFRIPINQTIDSHAEES
jgi:hypothetical protein